VAHPSRDDFRSDIVGSAAHCPFPFILKLKFGGQAEVSNLDIHGGVEKYVGHFEVSVNDLERV
jgi:hypothetical protein